MGGEGEGGGEDVSKFVGFGRGGKQTDSNKGVRK